MIKTGKKRCCFYQKRRYKMEVTLRWQALPPSTSIGAGDNFCTGFIAALLEGKTLRECARFANATAAISASCGAPQRA
ncbi:hypothetical protein KCP73_24210 [Salmonella enterica subsp. enterica]|nr:hypothetical protein KCP73_24210 [Salmonella enterica subsp. enterica]